ncbi:MAG: hypothetical protein V4684_16000 [Pseudomonadota bacterium]
MNLASVLRMQLSYRTRSIAGVLAGVLYALAVFASQVGVSTSGITPDTASYLEFSPYRQPLYGLWAHFIYAATSSWAAVLQVQLVLFVLAVAWATVELARISTWGVPAALFFIALQCVLLRMGMVGLVGTLSTEGLFYSMIVAGCALMLHWLRTRSRPGLALMLVLLVAMTQLRPAALLVLGLPVGAAIVAVVAYGWRSASGRLGLATLATTVVLIGVMPVLMGKQPFQLGTSKSWFGFAALPRTALLHPPADIAQRVPRWSAMQAGWREAAKDLDAIELGQFDAQLQEAVRWELAPKALFPEYLRADVAQTAKQWEKGELYNEAADLALRYLRSDIPTYARLSLAHFWGMLTMGNYMSNGQRANVWIALNALPAPTWELARFRTDYPLNQIDKPMSLASSLLYFVVRYALMIVLALGVFAGGRTLLAVWKRRDLSPGDLALLATVGWAALHSVPAALTVFAEFRYTYANLLCVALGALAWFAYLGHARGTRANTEGRA